jgi:hypothetical protein
MLHQRGCAPQRSQPLKTGSVIQSTNLAVTLLLSGVCVLACDLQASRGLCNTNMLDLARLKNATRHFVHPAFLVCFAVFVVAEIVCIVKDVDPQWHVSGCLNALSSCSAIASSIEQAGLAMLNMFQRHRRCW